MTPEGSRKKRRMSRPREKDEENEGARRVTKTEKNGICKKRECLETKVFPPVTTSLKRGIINIYDLFCRSRRICKIPVHYALRKISHQIFKASPYPQRILS